MSAEEIFWQSVEKKKYVFGNISQKMFRAVFKKRFFKKQSVKHKKENLVSWRNEVKQRKENRGRERPHCVSKKPSFNWTFSTLWGAANELRLFFTKCYERG